VKERGIIFAAPMIRALRAGVKTQTRRILKSPHAADIDIFSFDAPQGLWEGGIYGDSGTAAHGEWVRCPYGSPGDRLWVRETFLENYGDAQMRHAYRADWTARAAEVCPEPKWKPSIFMPRALSRLTLEITDVRVERVRAISSADALAEGIEPFEGCTISDEMPGWDPVEHYAKLWDSINGKRAPWSANPFVWAITFRVLT
jgi:hypothetical protein